MSSVLTPKRRPATRRQVALKRPGERLWIHPAYRALLEAAGLDSFDAFMAGRHGTLLRKLPDRDNWRLEIPQRGGEPRRAYLKVHWQRAWWVKLAARLGQACRIANGTVEADYVRRLAARGIANIPLMACGHRIGAGGALESFILTDELTGYLPLDGLLRQSFPRAEERPARRRDQRLADLSQAVASVARRLHALGYNHRDLYCCHFFVASDVQRGWDVKLIDLHRVQHRRRWRHRWIVKDLAQMAYSAPRERLTATDRLAFIKRYLGVRKLQANDKRLIREVIAKWRHMERTLGMHP